MTSRRVGPIHATESRDHHVFPAERRHVLRTTARPRHWLLPAADVTRGALAAGDRDRVYLFVNFDDYLPPVRLQLASCQLDKNTYARHIYGRPALGPQTCVADADIIFLSCFYLPIFFFPRLISAVADWMSAILRYMVWP